MAASKYRAPRRLAVARIEARRVACPAWADTLPGHGTTTRRAGDEAHLHVYGRGTGAGDALAAADRRGLCRPGRRGHRVARHLARGSHPRAVPGPLDR